MEKCSYCGQENGEKSVTCERCGTPLPGNGTLENPAVLASANPARSHGEKLILQGALWFIGGVGFTLFTYLVAANRPGGGYYVVAYGAIFFGIVQAIRGISGGRGSDGNARAQEFLDAAAQLESVDRAQAITVYQEVIKQFPGTPASKEAQRSIQTLTEHVT